MLSERFRALGGVLDATYDFFIRTTDPEHEAEVQRILERINESGDVYRGSYGGWYCSSCERFYAEDELVEGRRCPIHGTPVEWLEEENWFFRLSAYRDRLLAHYDANPGWVLPAARRNEARRMIEDWPRRPLDLPGPGRMGRPGAVGPGADRLRVDRRAAQLPHRPWIRAAGDGPGAASGRRTSSSWPRTS